MDALDLALLISAPDFFFFFCFCNLYAADLLLRVHGVHNVATHILLVIFTLMLTEDYPSIQYLMLELPVNLMVHTDGWYSGSYSPFSA